jgi:hypothetical protein
MLHGIPSVTAAMKLASFPAVDVAVRGRAVLGRAAPGVDRVTDCGLLNGNGALRIREMEPVLPVLLTGVEEVL